MTLVEMIEALQKEWFGVIEARKKNGQDGTIEAVIGMHARSLQPVLAAAREQEQELAAMKEPMECEHPKAFLVWEPNMDEPFTIDTSIVQQFCSLCRQHSADLREIAEMAIEQSAPICELCKEGLPIKSLERMEHGHWTGVTFDGHTLPSGEHVACLKRKLPTPDSILAAFREKQQKAEVKAQ